jgi:hypothetical protein
MFYLNDTEEKISKTSVEITTSTEISCGRVYSLLVGAFEGGSGYWMRSWGIAVLPHGYTRSDIEFAHAEVPLLRGGCLEVTDIDGNSHALDLPACKRGLEIMAREHGRHWQDFVREGDDAITADVFLQCACMGEVIYG